MSPWQPRQEPQLLPGKEEYKQGSPLQLSQLLPAAKISGADNRAAGGAIGCVGCCDQ